MDTLPVKKETPETLNDKFEHAKKHVPKCGIDYDWVLEYSYKELEKIEAVIRDLDQKATAVITYLGAFTGFSVVSVLMSGNTNYILTILPMVLCSIAGIWTAICVIQPRKYIYPPDTQKALEYAEAYDTVSPARFALMIGVSVVSQRSIIKIKAEFVRRSLNWFMYAVMALLLPIGKIFNLF